MIRKLEWYINRFRSMDAAEVAQRVGHLVLQRMEAFGLRNVLAEDAQDWEANSGFPQLEPKGSFPDSEAEHLANEVNEIKAGRWKVMHGHTFNVSFPVEWQRDYLSGTNHECKRPSRNLNHRELPGTADIRMIWEPNRWCHLVKLAQAAWILDDDASAAIVIELLGDWTEANPPGTGWNWTNPMEPAIRLTNLVWIDALLEKALVWSKYPGSRARILQKLVAPHVWWVSRYRSVGSSANNHLLVELTGLLLSAARWPQCVRWGESVEELGRVMEEQIFNQFYEDGGNKEQALHYHLFALEACWQSLQAIRAAGGNPSVEVENRLGNACRFFTKLVHPHEPWDYGDSDDACLTPVYCRRDSVLEEWKNWCGGQNGKFSAIRFWLGLAPNPSDDPKHKRIAGGWDYFPESGLACFRENENWMARLDASPLGFGSMAAHGHLDALHLSLWYGKNAVIVDPGTGGYYASPRERAYFPSWEAHNGPHFVGDNSPKRHGPFLWSGKHEQPVINEVGDGIMVSLGREKGKVTRRIETRNCEWFIDDSCASAGQERFQVFWQLAPEFDNCEIVEDQENCFRFSRNDTKLTVEIRVSSAIGVELIRRGRHLAGEIGPGSCSPWFRKTNSGFGLVAFGQSGDESIDVQTRIKTISVSI